MVGVDELERKIWLREFELGFDCTTVGDRFQPVGEQCDLPGKEARVCCGPRATVVRGRDLDVQPVGVLIIVLDRRELVAEYVERELVSVLSGKEHDFIVGGSEVTAAPP